MSQVRQVDQQIKGMEPHVHDGNGAYMIFVLAEKCFP